MTKLLAPLSSLALAAILVVIFVGAFNAGHAAADGSGSGSVTIPVPTPADQLDNPLTNPVAAYDDLKAAKRIGWGVLVLAVLVMASRLLGMLGGVFAFLKKGRVSLVVAAVGTFAVTAYNALLLGGTWMAAVAAAIVAGAAAWDAVSKTPSP